MTDTTTPSMREEFEASLKSNYRCLDFTIHSDGNYIDGYVDTAWIAWKLCAENMQNKLDESKEEEDVSYQALMSVSKLLAQISITLKGEELPLHLHSYHDLPELVEKLKTDKSELEAKIAELQSRLQESKKENAYLKSAFSFRDGLSFRLEYVDRVKSIHLVSVNSIDNTELFSIRNNNLNGFMQNKFMHRWAEIKNELIKEDILSRDV